MNIRNTSLEPERTFSILFKAHTLHYIHDVSKATAFFLMRTYSLLDKIGTQINYK
jgi:hypothetical protein